MSDAPERIWHFAADLKKLEGKVIMMGDTEYIRADLHAARIAELERENERLREALTVIADEKGCCASCGKIAEGEGMGYVTCDGKRDADYNPYYDCSWEPLDVTEFARAAVKGET